MGVKIKENKKRKRCLSQRHAGGKGEKRKHWREVKGLVKGLVMEHCTLETQS